MPSLLNGIRVAAFRDTASTFALFSVSGLKDEKLAKKQIYIKTETCKYFCQISSKLILIIFLRHSEDVHPKTEVDCATHDE